MSKLIRNRYDLDAFMRHGAIEMLEKARNRIYEVIQESIEEYYQEYTPGRYVRTGRFLNSLVKTQLIWDGGGKAIWCFVKIDENYLNYTYPYTGRFNPSYPHDYDGRYAKGLDVARWANRDFRNDGDFESGNHGYTVDAGREGGFWDLAMDEVGDILKLLKKKLVESGFKVK